MSQHTPLPPDTDANERSNTLGWDSAPEWVRELPFYKHVRKINDPIHGFIRFEPSIWKFVDTRQFQRLRDVKQVGLCSYVFPGGTHTRFEHCLGTGFMASQLVSRLIDQQPQLVSDPTQKNDYKECVTLAGLCHDLGHGPFSHVFDGCVIPELDPSTTWTHEQASEMLLDYMIDDNHIDIKPENVKLIKSLIRGEQFSSNISPWIYEIVANKRNSLDVDKFDYISRDSYYVGAKDLTFDSRGLIEESLVINNEICYPSKMSFKIYDLFHTRYRLFKSIYLHRVNQALDMMVTDIFVQANSRFKFLDIIKDPEEYTYLTDSILLDIERSKSKELVDSRALIRRLRCRDLYKFVNEALILPEKAHKLPSDKGQIEREIVNCSSGDCESFTEKDIFVKISNINYAMKDQNPVDSVSFYRRDNPLVSFKLNRNDVSLLLPSEFSEKKLRVFVRDKSKLESVMVAFRQYKREKLGMTEGKAQEAELKVTPNSKTGKSSAEKSILTKRHDREESK
eukprot:TRINITY_DN8181_c0_g1_i1.p1 TRINITY_DN8181_c0_g1~~TRINITY_DN8181_c0_g1_i1.p1  ORF type:complete len:509 (-),score=70.18 TRINITY_DN8181_c0_g1_i1:40-1566(-)